MAGTGEGPSNTAAPARMPSVMMLPSPVTGTNCPAVWTSGGRGVVPPGKLVLVAVVVVGVVLLPGAPVAARD
jgi:hypothetical protein